LDTFKDYSKIKSNYPILTLLSDSAFRARSYQKPISDSFNETIFFQLM